MKIECRVPSESPFSFMLSHEIESAIVKTAGHCKSGQWGGCFLLEQFKEIMSDMVKLARLKSEPCNYKSAFAFYDAGLLPCDMLANPQFDKSWDIAKSYWIFEADWDGKSIRQSLERVGKKACKEYVVQWFDEYGCRRTADAWS